MKVAVCLSGHLRDFEAGGDWLPAGFREEHEVDVYLHTWATQYPTEGSWSDAFRRSPPPHVPTIQVWDRAWARFRPRRWRIETEVDRGQQIRERRFPDLPAEAQDKLLRLYSKFYSAAAAFDQALNDWSRYDVFLFTRPDVRIEAMQLRRPAEATLYCLERSDPTGAAPGWCDVVGWGDWGTMSTVSQAYLHEMHPWLVRRAWLPDRNTFHPEGLFAHWCLRKGIRAHLLAADELSAVIVREAGPPPLVTPLGGRPATATDAPHCGLCARQRLAAAGDWPAYRELTSAQAKLIQDDWSREIP